MADPGKESLIDGAIRNEWKVIAVVLCGVLFAEVGLRLGERRLSKDLDHLHEIPALAEKAAASSSDAVRVLFLGNSMMRYGIDSETFELAAREAAPVPLQITRIHPDATKIADWYYLFRNYFYERRQQPDVLIVGFQGDQLADQPTQHPERVARFYGCALEDLDALIRWDLGTFEETCGFGLSTMSAAYVNRERLQARVLDTIIPHYRESFQRMNSARLPDSSTDFPMFADPDVASAAPTYARLQEFVEMIRSSGVRAVFVAMPVVRDYDIDPEAVAILNAGAIPLIDCREVPELTAEHLPDGIHLNEEGAVRYSYHLAASLPWQRILWPSKENRRASLLHIARDRQNSESQPR